MQEVQWRRVQTAVLEGHIASGIDLADQEASSVQDIDPEAALNLEEHLLSLRWDGSQEYQTETRQPRFSYPCLGLLRYPEPLDGVLRDPKYMGVSLWCCFVPAQPAQDLD